MDHKNPKTPHITEKGGVQEKTEETPVMHTFNEQSASTTSSMKIIVTFIIVAVLGIGTGYLLSKVTDSTGKQLISVENIGSTAKGKTFGSDDLKIFKDIAEGKLEDGGVEGEGQFHLVRPGGDSQNVYLTSSLVDLSQFVGHKIKVWGQTQAAQHAGWLMDVGRVEVQ